MTGTPLTSANSESSWITRQGTRGSVVFRVADNAFTGDTLFKRSVGRTDLPGGSARDLLDSIITKLLVLDDATGCSRPRSGKHYRTERRANPFLQGITTL